MHRTQLLEEHPLQILIVDDEKDVGEVMAMTLHGKTYQVATVSSAQEALDRIVKHPVNILVTDLNMPGKSGFELIDEVLVLHPHTRVIVLTAHGSIDSFIQVIRLGAIDFLQKPVANEALKATLKSAKETLGVFQGITARKHTDEELKKLQKLDSLGKLTGGIAHDFNNLLSVIQGYSEMLDLSLPNDPKLSRYVSEIRNASERGAKLTHKLLAFARQQPTQAVSISINTLLQDDQHMLEKTLTARIKLGMDLESSLWPIFVNKGELEDAILNICINALHAMQEGGELSITTGNASLSTAEANIMGLKAGDYVRLALSDTGVGMPPDIQNKIFDPFFTTKDEIGTGLGLSQVFGFMKSFGGAIKVYSEPGYGTRFLLFFPRYTGDEIDIAHGTGTGKPKPAQDLHGEGTILVVDDELALRLFMAEILHMHGYKVLCAENGKQALQMLAQEPADLLLSDVIMPGMDGYELAVRVKKEHPHVKIQLISGFTDKHTFKMVDKELLQQLMYKPVGSVALLQRVHELLNKAGVQVISSDESMAKKASTSTHIKWSNDMSIGSEAIDSDHHALIKLLNHFQSAIDAGDADLDDILNKLMDYAHHHFKREEAIMTACGYPFLDNHRKVHRMFIKQVNHFRHTIGHGELSPQTLLGFMFFWFNEHTTGMDKGITPYLIGKEKVIGHALQTHAHLDS